MAFKHLLHRFLFLTLSPLSCNPRFFRLALITSIIALGLAIAWLPLNVTIFLMGTTILLMFLLRTPILSLYLLIPIIPFSTLLSVSLGSFKVGLMEVVLAAGLMAWLLQILTDQNPRSKPLPAPGQGSKIRWTSLRSQGRRDLLNLPTVAGQARPKILFWLFLIFLGGVGLSWLNTFSIGASLIETAKWVEMLALYLLVITLLPTQQIKWVIAALLLTGMAQAILGLYQFIFKVGPEGFLLFGGRFLRAHGTFNQPNPYAGYLGLVLPLALSLTLWSLTNLRFRAPQLHSGQIYRLRPGQIFDSSLSNKSKTRQLGFYISALSLLLAAFFATQSRGAWLGFVGAAIATIIVRGKKTAIVLVILATIGATIGLANTFDLGTTQISATATSSLTYGAMTQRLADAVEIITITDISTLEINDANFATIERLAHWQAAREMWRDNPWLGVGFGNYTVVYPAYAIGRWLDPLGHAHNYLLNIGAEAGLIGITAYLIFWILILRVTWLAIRRSQGFYRAVAAGGLGVLAHLHIHNLFDNLYVQGMYLHIAVILALISIIYHQGLSTTSK